MYQALPSFNGLAGRSVRGTTERLLLWCLKHNDSEQDSVRAFDQHVVVDIVAAVAQRSEY